MVVRGPPMVLEMKEVLEEEEEEGDDDDNQMAIVNFK